MEDRLSASRAVSDLAKKKSVTEGHARRVLIAALMLEESQALCSSYWSNARMADPPFGINEIARAEGTIPADFWRLNHANNHPVGCGPTGGAYGDWSRSVFTCEKSLTCDAASSRYPDLAGHFWEHGSARIELSWTVTDVTLHTQDIENLLRRTDWRSMVTRAERRQALPQGRKSDQLALYVRFAAEHLTDDDLKKYAGNPSLVKAALQLLAQSVSEDASLTDRTIDAFSLGLAHAARRRMDRDMGLGEAPVD